MRHTIYEDPVTHKFALIAVPLRFIDGDKLPIPQSIRWFNTREEAGAALPDLLKVDE